MLIPWGAGVSGREVFHTARVKTYPGGRHEVLVCDKPIFGGSGWEDARRDRRAAPRAARRADKGEAGGHDVARAVRRARAQVRDLALCNPFRWFVTLTLDKSRVNRYDMAEITRHLNHWLDNQVRRKGLAYVLVPERHKDGAVHFHGFFNDALEAVDSGTVSLPGQKRPRRPRSARQRAQWLEQGGHPVYNLPGWGWGFSTAIELYGEYDRAVSYVCKYIGKGMEASPNGDEAAAEGADSSPNATRQPAKVGGRWYYSGGALAKPETRYVDLDLREAMEEPGAYRFDLPRAGLSFCGFQILGGEGFGVPAGFVAQAGGAGVPLLGALRQPQVLGVRPGGGRSAAGAIRTDVREREQGEQLMLQGMERRKA